MLALLSLAAVEMRRVQQHEEAMREMERRLLAVETGHSSNASSAASAGAEYRATRTSATTSNASTPAAKPPPPAAAPTNSSEAKSRQLYAGRTAWRSSAELLPLGRPFQLLVLGYHQSGTSILTRLLMMMGAWAGKPEALWLCE